MVGGQRSASHAVHERGHARMLDESLHRVLGLGPVHVAARNQHGPFGRRDQSRDSSDRISVDFRAAPNAVDGRNIHGARSERVERDVDEGRPSVRRARGTTRGVDLGHDRLGRRRRGHAFGDRSDDRNVVELLQRPRTPTKLRSPPGEHHHRRTVHPRRGHRADAVGNARPGGDRRATELPGDLGPALGREHRGLFVAGVDQAQAGLHRAVVEHEQMPAREREHRVDAVRTQDLDREPAAVRLHRLPRGRGQRAEKSGERRDPRFGILELR